MIYWHYIDIRLIVEGQQLKVNNTRTELLVIGTKPALLVQQYILNI